MPSPLDQGVLEVEIPGTIVRGIAGMSMKIGDMATMIAEAGGTGLDGEGTSGEVGGESL